MQVDVRSLGRITIYAFPSGPTARGCLLGVKQAEPRRFRSGRASFRILPIHFFTSSAVCGGTTLTKGYREPRSTSRNLVKQKKADGAPPSGINYYILLDRLLRESAVVATAAARSTLVGYRRGLPSYVKRRKAGSRKIVPPVCSHVVCDATWR